jgi:hypothetical protein
MHVSETERTKQERLFRLALLQAALADICNSQRGSWDLRLRSAAEEFVGRRRPHELGALPLRDSRTRAPQSMRDSSSVADSWRA